MPYTKSDMIYKDYHWTPGYKQQDPRVSGELDDTCLTRTEGKQMLYFINKCAEMWRWGYKLDKGLRKLEKVVREVVPENVQSQREIKTWIDQNSSTFWSKVQV